MATIDETAIPEVPSFPEEFRGRSMTDLSLEEHDALMALQAQLGQVARFLESSHDRQIKWLAARVLGSEDAKDRALKARYQRQVSSGCGDFLLSLMIEPDQALQSEVAEGGQDIEWLMRAFRSHTRQAVGSITRGDDVFRTHTPIGRMRFERRQQIFQMGVPPQQLEAMIKFTPGDLALSLAFDAVAAEVDGD